MSIIPETTPGFCNAWILTVTYALFTLAAMIFIPKEKRKRIVTFPSFKSKQEKIAIGLSSFIFGRGLIFYSIFIPIKPMTIAFYFGISLYSFGMLLSIYAIWVFAKADLSKPVTGGIYRITRHPMQIMSLIMWTGIGITGQNWIVIACVILMAIFYNPSFIAQERYCTEKYGSEYTDYMKRTPRYLFLK